MLVRRLGGKLYTVLSWFESYGIQRARLANEGGQELLVVFDTNRVNFWLTVSTILDDL